MRAVSPPISVRERRGSAGQRGEMVAGRGESVSRIFTCKRGGKWESGMRCGEGARESAAVARSSLYFGGRRASLIFPFPCIFSTPLFLLEVGCI